MVVSENDDTAVVGVGELKRCRRVPAAGVENAIDWRLLSRRRSVVVSAEIMVVQALFYEIILA